MRSVSSTNSQNLFHRLQTKWQAISFLRRRSSRIPLLGCQLSEDNRQTKSHKYLHSTQHKLRGELPGAVLGKASSPSFPSCAPGAKLLAALQLCRSNIFLKARAQKHDKVRRRRLGHLSYNAAISFWPSGSMVRLRCGLEMQETTNTVIIHHQGRIQGAWGRAEGG